MKLAFPKTFISPLKTDRVVGWSVRIGLIIFALTAFILVWFWQKLPPEIPFFYSLPWGEDQLGRVIYLIFFAGSLLLLFFLNILLTLFLYPRSAYLAKLLVIGSTTISLLGLYSLIQIIFLVA